MHVVEREEPAAPLPGQVLVRVRAVSLNYRDILVARGFQRWQPPSGRIPGSDAAGEVIATGTAVARVKPGDRVMSTILPRWIDGPLTAQKLDGSLGGAHADGVLAEYVLLDAESVVPIPDYLSDVEGACLPCAALTAWHALSRADSLRPGATVLVQGTGGVSLFALQLAVAAGAQVIVISSSDQKLARARELGAIASINYRTRVDWDREVLRITNGQGVQHVIDVGGASTIESSISAAAFEGTVSIVGLIGGLDAKVDLSTIFIKNLRVHGVETGSRRMLEAMAAWMSERGMHPMVDRRFALDEVCAAFHYLAAAAHMGKVCVVF